MTGRWPAETQSSYFARRTCDCAEGREARLRERSAWPQSISIQLGDHIESFAYRGGSELCWVVALDHLLACVGEHASGLRSDSLVGA